MYSPFVSATTQRTGEFMIHRLFVFVLFFPFSLVHAYPSLSLDSDRENQTCQSLKYDFQDIEAHSCAYREFKQEGEERDVIQKMTAMLQNVDFGNNPIKSAWAPLLNIFDVEIPKLDTTGRPSKMRLQLYSQLIHRYLEYKRGHGCSKLKAIVSGFVLSEPFLFLEKDPLLMDPMNIAALRNYSIAGEWSPKLDKLGLNQESSLASRDAAIQRVMQKRDWIAGIPLQIIDHLTVCNRSTPVLDDFARFTAETIYPECVLDLGSAFTSNSDQLNKPLKEIAVKDPLFLSCLNRAKEHGLSLSKAVVQTSSDTREQTGITCSLYGPRGFMAFSKSRADQLRLQARDLLDFVGISEETPIEEKFDGDHGDGTSGPCAYEISDDSQGRFVSLRLKSEFANQDLANDRLRKYRTAKIILSFQTKTESEAKQDYQYSASVHCQRIGFQCAE